MKFNLSTNISQGVNDNFNYIVTPNAQKVYGNIVDSFQAGIHSFSIIGTYGTGKSSFLMALEQDLLKDKSRLVSKKQVFANAESFEFMNIVGDYSSLSTLLSKELSINPSDDSKNIFSALTKLLTRLKSLNKFLFIFIDEFGKILEHAANNNPEKELYFLQTLAEFVNVSSRNVILIITLHQNFGAYSYKLTETQRNEWLKVKGRFKELVFAEPVEQLLFLAAESLTKSKVMTDEAKENFLEVFSLAKKNKIISESLSLRTSKMLYPLDAVAASCLTLAIQKYGQNERTLFSFLHDTASNSINGFIPNDTTTYNLAVVYDYIIYNFYSALAETNIDSTNWRAIRVALERVESGVISKNNIDDALKIVKTIGLLNLFYNGVVIDLAFLEVYASKALGIKNPMSIIDKLTANKIIRFAAYKSQFILFEGTDINIEDELYKAATIVPVPKLVVTEIAPYVKKTVVVASASYYKTGTPRYFQFVVSNEPYDVEPTGDEDGFINLIFPLEDVKDRMIELSATSGKAIVYAYFDDTEKIVKHLYEIKKLQYLLDNVVLEDRIAKGEILKQKAFETQLLNETINKCVEMVDGQVKWFFNGKQQVIKCRKDFNKLLSTVCDSVYKETPIIRNELFNKQKISSAVSLARVNLLDAMIEHWQEENFGFSSNQYPPERTIYNTLLKSSGIHRQNEDGLWILGEPITPELQSIWAACSDFLVKSTEKPLKLSDLVKTLKMRPYKLKQGVIDFWLPIFLFVKQQEYALYNGETFVLNINKELFELLQKRLNDFTIKAFDVSGIKLELFNKYREFLNKERGETITSKSLMDTIRPFFNFYRGLNKYAQTTRKFDYDATAKFRDILATAKDPCKAFLEDIPSALGYNDLHNEDFINQYLQLIKTAVHELVICYDLFVDRIEETVVGYLGLPHNYLDYKEILVKRYSNINKGLLTAKSKSFLDRILAPSDNKREFYEKIGLVVFDRKIETIEDKEEALFLSNLTHLFGELERYTAFNEINYETDEIAFNFELATSKGDFKSSRTYRLPKVKIAEAKKIENKIQTLLSGNEELDVCILLKMLNERL
ncbi:ATP-binding protein [uncultured Bacteroides sp.]|uniref:ATP-binding protein n=1 Tax=uncultured Bacteroides sp. TaxID=162156 RepID=UPI002598ADBB|nr:ATP-binding protein [uncultured Bacteroides sp.]